MWSFVPGFPQRLFCPFLSARGAASFPAHANRVGLRVHPAVVLQLLCTSTCLLAGFSRLNQD